MGPLDPEAGLARLPLSLTDAALRRRYLREKKVPQLRWMLHQAANELTINLSVSLTG